MAKSPKKKRSEAVAQELPGEAPVESPVESTAEPQQLPAAASTVALGASCTVKDAAALKTSLCAVVEAQDAVVLDANGVERVDTATIQLLCAFVRERVANGRGVVWQGSSSALSEAARLLGVQSLLALPQADPTGAAA